MFCEFNHYLLRMFTPRQCRWLKPVAMHSMRRFIHCASEKSMPVKLTILGNLVPTARMVALLLKQCSGLDEIRLYGTDELTCQSATDLAHLDTNVLIKAYQGDNRLLKESIKDASIILVCGGYPTCPQESEEELFQRNVGPVRNVVLHCVEYNPSAIMLLATPPINVFLPMISEEYKREDVYEPKRIIGIPTLSTVLANAVIGKHIKYDATNVHCPVIGGDSHCTRIPVLSQCTPSLDVFGEDERQELFTKVVSAIDSCLQAKSQEHLGPLYLAHAFSISRFVTNLINALRGTKSVYECAFVRQTGHVGLFLPYMQTVVELGACGIENTFMPKMNKWECDQLLTGYPKLRTEIHKGTSFVNGELKYCPASEVCLSSLLQRVLRNEYVGDVLIDFTQKYPNLEIYH